MAVNPCCCWNIKDGAVTVGLWSLIYALASLVLFGWQMNVISSCQTVVMSQANLQCEYWCPCVGASNARTSALIEGLFVIQILCLIASFFLLFAACSLIYGAHTYSRCLVWPWLPCMITSILCTLAYCIMWWTGDVRDYWLVLTILEMVTVLINLYCVFVVLLFYRRMNGEIAYYNEKNGVTARYGPDMYDEYKKDNYGMSSQIPELEYPMQPGYRGRAGSPRREQYTRLQEYRPAQQQPQPAPVTPTSVRKATFEDDLVSSWVKQQQAIKELPDHANSEPVTPEAPNIYPLKHSYSVPSMYAETSGATSCQHRRHKHHHHHHKHRSSSRSRRHGRGDYGRRRSSSRHQYRSTSASQSSESGSTDYSEEPYRVRHRSRSRDRYYYDNGSVGTDDSRLFEELRPRRTRYGTDDRDDSTRYKDRRRGPRRVKRDQRDAKEAAVKASSGNASPTVAVQTDSVSARWPLDPQKGFTFPQQIIIPPSRGSIGPDGRPQPQTYQINSEIRISYDQQGRPVPHEVAALPRESPMPEQQQSPAAVARPQPQPFSVTSVV